MLLIHGEILDNSFTQVAIKKMGKTLFTTLKDKQLNQDKIIDAIDRLMNKLLNGEYTNELSSFDISLDASEYQR